jgi:hypothetical protein
VSLAAIGSASATFLLGSFGLAGTVLGAALTPVIVALVSELVRRPARTVTVRAGAVRTGTAQARPRTIDRGERRSRLSFDHVRPKRVVITGLAAFAAVVAAVSIADLASGGSVTSGRDSTFFTPGKPSSPDPAPADQSPASTSRSETTETTETEEEAPAETTVTDPPPATTAPSETTTVP